MGTFPDAVVRTPHGARYLPPPEDYPDDVVAAIDQWFARFDRPSRRRRVRYCGADSDECGRHSGIPACCRAWFRTAWRPNAFMFGRPAWWLDDWGYIACPGCRQ